MVHQEGIQSRQPLVMSIEPQYDGVIMLSSESVHFSDAKPRPDGRKVYHVFEKSLEVFEEQPLSDDFCTRREALFSLAHENTIHNIQQVLNENGTLNQEWCAVATTSDHQVTSYSTSLMNCPIYSQATIHSMHNQAQVISSEHKSRVCSVQIQQTATPISVYQQPISSPQHISSALYYQSLQPSQLVSSIEQLVLDSDSEILPDSSSVDQTCTSLLNLEDDTQSYSINSVTLAPSVVYCTLPDSNNCTQEVPGNSVTGDNQHVLLTAQNTLDLHQPLVQLHTLPASSTTLSLPIQVQPLSPSSSTSQITNQSQSSTQQQPLQISTIQYQQPVEQDLSSIQYHLFEMTFPSGPKRRGKERKLTKKLRQRGATQIDLEPENRRIGIKTSQPYRSIVTLLKKMDPAIKHIVTTQEVYIYTEETAHSRDHRDAIEL